MGRSDFVIGCVGKPSAGKSTFFNAATDSVNAKVGAYPFTTIEPNTGVAHVHVTCPCSRWPVRRCTPRYGVCHEGRRAVPVKLLDVAGLIPGASEGRGLGNKFLDDLRHADVLLHILDISGTTNEKGEATLGYDPEQDHEWLLSEIRLWVFNNLWSRWPQIARKHEVTNSTLLATLQGQLSGYGADKSLLNSLLSAEGLEDQLATVRLTLWTRADVEKLVEKFVDLKFPFILVLNKADLPGGATDTNIIKMSTKYPESTVVVASALAECFLLKLRRQKFISYWPGERDFEILRPLDERTKSRLERIKDLTLYRYGETGVQQAVDLAVQLAGLFPVFPVRSREFSTATIARPAVSSSFAECMLIPRGTTVGELAGMLHDELLRCFVDAEDGEGRQMAEDEEITPSRNIIKINTRKK